MSKSELFILISNVAGVGIATISKILEGVGNNPTLESVMKIVGKSKLKTSVREELLNALKNHEAILSEYLKYMKSRNISLLEVKLLKGDYSLKDIYKAPEFLYKIGNLNSVSNCIAVIGARNCSEYGRRMAFDIGRELALNGYVVVSGMAYGVDAYAHKGALQAKGSTIAVLGSGVDVCYPKSNYKLFEEIKRNGLILSEYGLEARPTKYTFPQRNRIISGLCKAVIVVEAKERSGTMITVQYALEQGRQIFAVPGNINSELSEGTNALIKNGATPYTSIKDLLENI